MLPEDREPLDREPRLDRPLLDDGARNPEPMLCREPSEELPDPRRDPSDELEPLFNRDPIELPEPLLSREDELPEFP